MSKMHNIQTIGHLEHLSLRIWGTRQAGFLDEE